MSAPRARSWKARRSSSSERSGQRTPAWKSGLPENCCIVAINGKSVEFRRFKEVKKLIELAQRPVTIAFSTEEEPVTFPASARKAAGAELPAYARRPV